MSAPMNAQRGQALEDLLIWQHSIYQGNRKATIWNNGLKAEVKSSRRRGDDITGHNNIVLVKSRPDFEGVLTCMQGRHVAFDAKVVSTMRYRHENRRMHQLADLYDVHIAGGIAFLLVAVNLEDFFIVWPHSVWGRAKFSVDLGLCQRVPINGNYRLPDWLSIVQEPGREVRS